VYVDDQLAGVISSNEKGVNNQIQASVAALGNHSYSIKGRFKGVDARYPSVGVYGSGQINVEDGATFVLDSAQKRISPKQDLEVLLRRGHDLR